MSKRLPGFISAEANMRAAHVKSASAGGRSQNPCRTRQALRGIKEMFRKDGLL
jgi:hypothetical protein